MNNGVQVCIERRRPILKITRAFLSALMLMVLMAFPASAQEEPLFSGRVVITCESVIEFITVENTGTVPFIVDSISSLVDPGEDEPFQVRTEIEAGRFVQYYAGPQAYTISDDTVLTTQFIFDDEDDAEGVEVAISTEGESTTVRVDCGDRSGTFGGDADDQQDGEGITVTKTFELTLNGDVPEGQAFNVSYNLTGVDHDVLLPFCGRGTDVECKGGGAIYTVTVDLDAGRSIDVRFVRIMTETEEAETFLEYTEVLDSDETNMAFYTFGKGDDDQQELPKELPKTGIGGIAPSAFPVGNALAGASLLVAAAYAGLRWR